MSSDHGGSTLSKQEKTDRIIAVVVVALFIGAALFFMAGNEDIETTQEISATVSHEEVTGDDIELPTQEEISDEMEIEGRTYKMDRESSRTIDRSYHYRAVEDSPKTSGVIDRHSDDGQVDHSLSHHDHDHSDDHHHNTEQDVENQQATPGKETTEKAAIPVRTIANVTPVVEEPVVEEVVKQPVVEIQHSDQKPTANAQPTDCVIIIGAYRQPSNVTRLKNRLERDSYDHFTVPYKDLTRVGVRVSCDAQSYGPILNTIRNSYAEDAVLLQPK